MKKLLASLVIVFGNLTGLAGDFYFSVNLPLPPIVVNRPLPPVVVYQPAPVIVYQPTYYTQSPCSTVIYYTQPVTVQREITYVRPLPLPPPRIYMPSVEARPLFSISYSRDFRYHDYHGHESSHRR
jgi:hypothetical protein